MTLKTACICDLYNDLLRSHIELERELAALRTRNAQLEAYESAWRKFVSLQTGDVQKLRDTAIELQRTEEELAALKAGGVVCVPRDVAQASAVKLELIGKIYNGDKESRWLSKAIFDALAASQGRKQADAELFHDAYKRFRP